MYTDIKSALQAAKQAQTFEELMAVVRNTSAQAASVGWVLAPTRLNMTNNAPIFQAA